MPVIDRARERLDFGVSDGGKSFALKSDGESADAAEQVEMGWLFIHKSPLRRGHTTHGLKTF